MLNTNKKPIDLSVDALKAEACRTARMDDWGDEEFHLPLEQLIKSFRNKYSRDTDEMAYFHFQNAMMSILVNRLNIQDNYTAHPEILRVPLKRPLFIVGLARTGSTLLHRLMNHDLSSRVLLYWEMMYPFMGPNVGLNHEKLSIKLAELKIKEIYSSLPDLYPIHEIKAIEPEECNIIMRHTFCSLYVASEWGLPQFAQWLVNHDMTESYLYYRKLMQLLLWHKPGNFLVLKCPSHLFNLNVILKVFPDANIVWLHRNPLKSIPSYLDLLSVFWGNEIHNKNFIDFIVDYWLRSVESGMEVERNMNPPQCLHLSYNELVRDHVSAIDKIYKYFNYPGSEGMGLNVRKWLEKNTQHKHGVHKYNLEKFGLTEDFIRERFSMYFHHFRHLL